MAQNIDKLNELLLITTTDGTSQSVQNAAGAAARFISSI